MSKPEEMTHLQKAQGALAAAKLLKEQLDARTEGNGDETPKTLLAEYLDMMQAAQVQAAVAQADAMDRLAFLQECQLGLRQIGERYKSQTGHKPQAGYV